MKYISVAIVIAFLSFSAVSGLETYSGSTNSTRNATNICTGIPTGDRVRNVNNCAHFFTCPATGIPSPGQCGNGWNFNATTQSCVGTPVQCFRCPSNVFIDIPVDYQCIQFIRCFAGAAQQRTCSEGLLFDPATKQCNLASEVTCGCPAVDIVNRPFFVRDRKKCDKYHVCVGGKALQFTCAKGLYFNLVNQQCDHKDNVHCDGPNTTGHS